MALRLAAGQEQRPGQQARQSPGSSRWAMRPWRSGGQARMSRLSRGAGASAAREAREEREEHGQKGVHAETGGQVSMAGDDTELRRRAVEQCDLGLHE
jgi:hypothetical protein